jgi:hypothetical protein
MSWDNIMAMIARTKIFPNLKRMDKVPKTNLEIIVPAETTVKKEPILLIPKLNAKLVTKVITAPPEVIISSIMSKGQISCVSKKP